MKWFVLVGAIVLAHSARGWLDSQCTSPGALRCEEDGRHVMTCVDGVGWQRDRDCGLTNETCVNGKCVRLVAQRPLKCSSSYGEQKSCSGDCTSVLYCNSNSYWTVFIECVEGKVCLENVCTIPPRTFQCGVPTKVICGTGTGGINIPNVEDCKTYYECTQDDSTPILRHCGERGAFFDAGTGLCTAKTGSACLQYGTCRSSYSSGTYIVFTNPSLYFVCNGPTYNFRKCSKGYYDPKLKKCDGASGYFQETKRQNKE